MKIYLLLIIFLLVENARGQAGYCNMNITAVPDTVCLDSAFLSVQIISSVSCTTYGLPHNQNEYQLTQYSICGSLSRGDYAGCGPGGKLIIAVIDSITFQSWSNENANYGQVNTFPNNAICRSRAENFFQFNVSDTTQVDSAASMLTSKIPNGDYILAYSFEHFDCSALDTALAAAFRNLGFNGFDTIKDVPFIYFVQKGKPNTVLQKVGLNSADIISLNATVTYTYPLPNVIYSWTPCNTLDSCSVRSPVAKPGSTTLYHLTATDTVTHLALVDSITVVYNCAAAVKNYLSDNTISVFPNPATNQLTIHPVGWSSNGVNTSSFHNEAVTVSVMNVLGQETSPPAPLHMERGDATIDVSNLSAGIYFVHLITQKERWVGKFIKE